MGGDAFAAQAVNLEADDLADRDDVFPGFDGIVAAGSRGNGAVKERLGALVVEPAVRAVELGVMGDDDAGLARRGVWSAAAKASLSTAADEPMSAAPVAAVLRNSRRFLFMIDTPVSRVRDGRWQHRTV